MAPAKVLIIGFGYLGAAVSRRWAPAGARFFATTRHPERRDELSAAGAQPMIWDVLRGGENLPQCDVVVYAVGFDRAGGDDMEDVYVRGLELTLESLPLPQRLVYISSTGVYGDAGGAWVDESTPPNPADESGQICLDAERVVENYSKGRLVESVILRSSGLYGPGRMIGVEQLKAGAPIRSEPDVFLNLIHVEDAARAVVAAAIFDGPEPLYFLSDGNPPTRREFYEEAALLIAAGPPTFQPTASARFRGSRRISNRLMRRDLLGDLLFPDFRAGLRDATKPI